MITEDDFKEKIREYVDVVFSGDDLAAKECYELSKEMSFNFLDFCIKNGQIKLDSAWGMSLQTNVNNVFELYIKSNQ